MDKKEKKLFLLWTPSYYPRFGGLESATREYASFLKERGWKVKIISNKYPVSLPKSEQIDNINIKRYLFLSRPIHYLKNKRLDLFFAYIVFKPITLFRLIFYFKKNKPSIVNVHFPDNQLIELVILSLFFKFNLIVSMHGNEVERLSEIKKDSFRYMLYLKIFDQSKYISFCSNYLLKKFKEIFTNTNEDKLMVVNNGVNKNFITSKITIKKKNYFFSASRFTPKKGLSIVFKIFEDLNMKELQIAGGSRKDGESFSSNITQNIKFLGVLSRNQIINRLKSSALTIIPTKNEPYGIIVAEALCLGSPIVTTKVGGIPELVNSVRNKLNIQQKNIFDQWVKVVEPNETSIKNGIKSIISNKNSIKEYISLVESFRHEFLWENKLKILINRIENFD